MPAVGVGTNIAALKAQRRLSESSGLFSKSMERLASGLRINRASDDAAGLAISSALNTNSRVFGQAVRNVNDGISYLAIAQGALGQLSDIVVRQRELAEQAANGVFSSAQRAALDLEANRLVDEYNRIIEGTEFNGKKILQDLEDGEEIRIQAGYGVNGSLSLSLLTTTTTAATGAGDGTFGAASNFDGNFGADIEAADINGDGNYDLFIASTSLAEVTVVLGNSDGTFNTFNTYDISGGDTFDQIVVADFNDDTILDVVASTYNGSNGHVLLLGNSDGSLTASTFFASGGGYLTGGDFNGDGRTDIISANSSGGNLEVRLSNGDGTFAISTDFSFPASPNDITVGYFNGDSYLDIARLEDDDSGIYIYTGNGNGTFTRTVDLYIAGDLNYKADIQSADFNGDGKADLIATTETGVSVLLGNGNATFQAESYYTTTAAGVSAYGSIAIGDFNGDGRPDVAVTNEGAAAVVSILLGNSDGSFQGRTNYSTSSAGSGVVSKDFNDDGILDLAVSHTGTDRVHVLLGGGTEGSGSTTTTTGVTLTASAISLLSAASARTALDTLATRQQEITSTIGKFGAFESRLQVANNLLNVVKDNYTMASSRIKDADIASESAEVIRSRILQQASSAVLAQANQVPALALALLRG